MSTHTPGFTLEVEGIVGSCPAGEQYAVAQRAAKATPVLSCEGPCVRGEIARIAANLVAEELPGLARACHAEAFFVPHSGMRRWIATAERVVMIDGCFLKCHGRVLNRLVPEEKIVHFDALSFYRKHTDVFAIDAVPEEERRACARQVADGVGTTLAATATGACKLR